MIILDHVPTFGWARAISLAKSLYGLTVSASHLPSERDQNFLLTASDGQRYVLKIANALERPGMLQAQQLAMAQVIRKGGRCPRVVPTLSGQGLANVSGKDGENHLVWLVTFMPGRPLGEIKYRSPQLIKDIGRGLGKISQAISGFEHPALPTDFHWDLANGSQVIDRFLRLVDDPLLAGSIAAFVHTYQEYVGPRLSTIHRGVIHNDANDYNILVGGNGDPYSRNQQFIGLVDFGDMVNSFMVAEPAVALAYLMLDAADPLGVASELIGGYHAEFPLLEDELDLIYPLALLRLCLSVCLAAYQRQQRPENDYLSISQLAIQRTLPRLLNVPWGLAGAALRQACGFPAVHTAPTVVTWLKERAGEGAFGSLLGQKLQVEPMVMLDLGVASPLLSSGRTISGGPQQIPEPELSRRIRQQMEDAKAQVAVGQYGEARLIYSSAAFIAPGTIEGLRGERRTVHLGVDLFAAAGSSILAPLEGTIAALADNDAIQDYGPVVVLAHETDSGIPFFTLYGHLSREALTRLEIGQRVGQGQNFAAIGKPAENGGWPPHLHFQIITTTLGPLPIHPEEGDGDGWGLTDFPGVAPASQEEIWRSLSPDPNLIVGRPVAEFPSPTPDISATLAKRRRTTGRNLSLSYQRPLKIVRGWKQYLFDHYGRRYLDAYNNVPHVGHCHPRIVAAGQRQLAILNTNTRYLQDVFNNYSERLLATFPTPLSVCYLLNSASEANELALRLARTFTGQKELIVLEAAYHGHTTGLIDISPYKHAGPGGQGPPEWVHTAPIPDLYRGPFKAIDPQAGERYASFVAEKTKWLRAEGRGPASFIAETFPSVGGQIIPPPGYLAAVYKEVRAAGGLCIADEVQTGFGRTGDHFYAFEAQGVVPDIVVLGKPIGNGHPLAAVVTTREIAEQFDTGMEFFSTFGGNSVSCAVGLAVLEVLAEEGLVEQGRQVGQVLLKGLRSLTERYPVVGDVRGAGLFLGMELVRDRQTLEPAGVEASFVADRMREHGILLGTDGPFHNVVKIRPPLPFDHNDAERLVETMDLVLAELDFDPG